MKLLAATFCGLLGTSLFVGRGGEGRGGCFPYLFPPLLSGDQQADPNPNTSVDSWEKRRENEVKGKRRFPEGPRTRRASRARPAPGLAVPGGLDQGLSHSSIRPHSSEAKLAEKLDTDSLPVSSLLETLEKRTDEG